MALVLVLCAALFAAICNLSFRKNLDFNGTSSAFLTLYFAISFLFSLMVNPIFENFKINFTMLGVGATAGVLQFLLMVLLARAIETGPSALSFTFQNAGSVLPAILLFFLFGPEFDFTLPLNLSVGIGLVLLGLFWSSSRSEEKRSYSARWLFFAIAVFMVQGLALTLFFWRCLLIDKVIPSHLLIPFKCQASDEKWFMPGFFLVPTILQTIRFFVKEKRIFFKKEWYCGLAGGITNATTTWLLLLATKWAVSTQKGILFPLFSISVIILCNVWAMKLYREKIKWFGIGICSVGILIGTL